MEKVKQEQKEDTDRRKRLDETSISANENAIKTSEEALKLASKSNEIAQQTAVTANWDFWISVVAVLASLFAAYTAYIKKYTSVCNS